MLQEMSVGISKMNMSVCLNPIRIWSKSMYCLYISTVLIAVLVLSVSALPVSASAKIVVDTKKSMSVSGKDDLAKLKFLASGVGWEFEPNEDAYARLKSLGIKYIRCINVDPLPGRFNANGSFIIGTETGRLDAHLNACRTIGAQPHVCMGMGAPAELNLQQDEVKKQFAIMGQQPGSYTYWNGDWAKFRAHAKAYFEYVIIKWGFDKARFEVGNEPDINGQFARLPGEPAGMGTRKLYEQYFEVYKNIAQAAVEFEKEHPGHKVTVGGPALAWAFSFSFGELNWADAFIRDCKEGKVRIDFIGIHAYGNISSLHGEYKASFPSFDEMLARTKAARDKYMPKVPILFTEWGPSYNTTNDDKGSVNADHVGAAWSAEFLNTMLENGVAGALYLVTTDLREPAKDGGYSNNWGWPSLFTNPNIYGKCYPKPIFNILRMVSMMQGKRVSVKMSGDKLGCFASTDRNSKTAYILLWNFNAQIHEGEYRTDKSMPQDIVLKFGKSTKLSGYVRYEVSENVSNSYSQFKTTGKPDDTAELQVVSKGKVKKASDGSMSIDFTLPKSGVTLLVISASD